MDDLASLLLNVTTIVSVFFILKLREVLVRRPIGDYIPCYFFKTIS